MREEKTCVNQSMEHQSQGICFIFQGTREKNQVELRNLVKELIVNRVDEETTFKEIIDGIDASIIETRIQPPLQEAMSQQIVTFLSKGFDRFDGKHLEFI